MNEMNSLTLNGVTYDSFRDQEARNHPVKSVNGKTGVVQLAADDVDAVPASQVITVTGIDADGVSHSWTMYGVAQ